MHRGTLQESLCAILCTSKGPLVESSQSLKASEAMELGHGPEGRFASLGHLSPCVRRLIGTTGAKTSLRSLRLSRCLEAATQILKTPVQIPCGFVDCLQGYCQPRCSEACATGFPVRIATVFFAIPSLRTLLARVPDPRPEL